MKIDVVGGNPSPAEVAAITAAFALVEAELSAPPAAPVAADGGHTEELRMWVDASRRSAQRALLQRGPWRLSGRLGRRSRT